MEVAILHAYLFVSVSKCDTFLEDVLDEKVKQIKFEVDVVSWVNGVAISRIGKWFMTPNNSKLYIPPFLHSDFCDVIDEPIHTIQ